MTEVERTLLLSMGAALAALLGRARNDPSGYSHWAVQADGRIADTLLRACEIVEREGPRTCDTCQHRYLVNLVPYCHQQDMPGPNGHSLRCEAVGNQCGLWAKK